MKQSPISALTRPEDMALSRRWLGQRCASPSQLPFSFLYDGKKIDGIPAAWHPAASTRRMDANVVETVIEGTDDDTGLTIRVELLRYDDFPTVEWTIWFSNTGKAPTPLLHDISAIDLTFAGHKPVLHHCNGDYYHEEGYTPVETPLPAGEELPFAPNGGRPCDGAFPYFRLQFAEAGLTLAIGWPGQWLATFSGKGDGVSIQAGQQQTHLRLMPGECIRTPRITVMSWTGDSSRAINLWRRWYLAHVLPRADGQPVPPLLAVAGTDEGEEFTAATEENQLRYQDKFAQLGFDYDVWWIDAGWYPCKNEDSERKWWLTGHWTPDPDRFPHGLKPISVNAARHGARFLLWFEPERVTQGSQLFQEHPEWLLRNSTPDSNSLLNLGNPACRQWLTDYVCAMIQQNGIGIYRQDFNFAPLEFWRANEAEDRQGLNENLHLQGYLQYWDDLLARNPGLLIDSCASGGRRNDLETMRRSVPLHFTDYGYGIHPVKLDFHRTMYAWIPYFKETTLSWDANAPRLDAHQQAAIAERQPHTDSFSFHCALTGMLMPVIDIHQEQIDATRCRRMIDIWRQAAPMIIHGDYYPFTPSSRSNERWVAWQFDRPELGAGLLQGIRLAACPEETCIVHPHGLAERADYIFENLETNTQIRLSAAALRESGFTFALPPRSGAIWFYRRVVAGE